MLKRCFCYLGAILGTNMDTTKGMVVAAVVLHNKVIMTNVDMQKAHIDAHVDDAVRIHIVSRLDNAILKSYLKLDPDYYKIFLKVA